jgi:tRNA-splicing ligase RtcB
LYSYHETGHAPLKLWDSHAPFEPQAMQQLRNIASLPFIHRHVAGMPDVHLGKGATVGSVIATKNAIIPAAVGVDIGCGMMAVRTSLTASDLPDNLDTLRSSIESRVPHGRTDNGGDNDRGAWGELPEANAAPFVGTIMTLWDELDEIVAKHPKIDRASKRAPRHLGTLGTGNHFIEICLDEEDRVWVMLHSGSRGIGNRIGSYFIELAKEDMRHWFINLPDADLAYFPQGTTHFDEYFEAVSWAQRYAKLNREMMMRATLEALKQAVPKPFETDCEVVNCHHNYVAEERHFGATVFVTRKGAVRAREGDLGIIPGSMGTGSFIVRGLGNRDSFCSCSHGAGRVMSRGQAKREITLEEHREAVKGISCRTDEDVLDESPRAYKDIGAVMKAQDDLVEIVHRLHQIINVKG